MDQFEGFDDLDQLRLVRMALEGFAVFLVKMPENSTAVRWHASLTELIEAAEERRVALTEENSP